MAVNQKSLFEVKSQGIVLGGGVIGEQMKGSLKRIDIASFKLRQIPLSESPNLAKFNHVLNEKGLFVLFNKKLLHADTAEFLKETGSAEPTMFSGTVGVPNPCYVWPIPTGVIATSIYAKDGVPTANLYWARLAEYHHKVGTTSPHRLPIFIDVQSDKQNKVIAILEDRIYTYKIQKLHNARFLQGKDLHKTGSMAETWLLCEAFEGDVVPKYYLNQKTGMPELMGNKGNEQ
ncbi:Uncharacterised protein [uncultured archaeon]|nr:Uncharacterised protein [uncultured archaeon]